MRENLLVAPDGRASLNLGLCPDRELNPPPLGVQDDAPTNCASDYFFFIVVNCNIKLTILTIFSSVYLEICCASKVKVKSPHCLDICYACRNWQNYEYSDSFARIRQIMKDFTKELL